MRQSDNELRCGGTFLGSYQISFNGMARLQPQSERSPIRSRTVAFLEQQEEQYESVRHRELFKDVKQIVLDGVLAESESIRNLLVAFALCGVFRHLQFARRKLINLAPPNAFAGWSASQGLQQNSEWCLLAPISPRLTRSMHRASSASDSVRLNTP